MSQTERFTSFISPEGPVPGPWPISPDGSID
jgi:hypothetical protein